MALVLTRKPGQKIIIDDRWEIEVDSTVPIRLIIRAPESVRIVRAEAKQRKEPKQ